MAQLRHWIILFRLQFMSVVILPFILGTIVAAKLMHVFHGIIFAWGLLAVLLVQLATHVNGEAFDKAEDVLSAKLKRNAFTGGSQMVAQGIISAEQAKRIGWLAVLLALGIGVLLQFYYRTGPWTLVLGLTGIIPGFFYSKPPIRWVSRGYGELFIAYCFGWLPLAVGTYLQIQTIPSLIHWMAIPVACTVFNIILINEFPDYPADALAGKRNLTVRIGKKNSALVYLAVSLIAIVGFVVSLRMGIPRKAAFWFFPAAILLGITMKRMAGERFTDQRMLGEMCAMTIAINWGTTLAYILGFVV